MKHTRAFSLIELLIVLFFFVIFTVLSLSSLFSWIKSAQIKTDYSVALEMKNIIDKGIKSNRIDFNKNDYAILWTSSNKNKIRNLLVSEMGKISSSNPNMVKKPKQNGYAFFVYLLPPYTTICLPIDSIDNIDTSTITFDSATDSFLSQRYSQSHYPQMYKYDTTTNTIVFNRPQILNLNDTVIDSLKHSYIGCINLKEDFD